jgi:FkbM family methyltransferase
MRLKAIASNLFLRVLGWASRSRSAEGEGYRFRILLGPLRGTRFSVLKLERSSFFLGTYEPHVVDAMRRHVMPGSVVYDVGANAGYLTLILARLVGAEKGRVFAFEADPANLSVLRANVGKNDLAQVSIVPKAVADFSGKVRFATFGYTLVSHIASALEPEDAKMVEVPSVSIDDFVYRDGNPPPAFLKVDVEGAEALVIRGGARTIREAKPVIVAEVRAGDTWNAVQEIIGPCGYTTTVLHGSNSLERDRLADLLLLPPR